MDRGNGGFRLKWPWNWVVCGVFVAAAWHFIGIFSLLLAALFLWWQKKRHPDAVPQGGYCLDRTRKRLARLLWSVLYLFLAAGGGVVFFMGFGEEKAELSDWAVWIVSGGAFLLFTGFFLGMPLMEVLMNLQGEKAAVVRDGNIFDHMKWYHGIGGAAVCLLLFLAVRGRKGSARAEQDKRSKKIAGALVALGAAVFGVLFAVLVLGGVDDSFGSGRGLLWRIAWESFMEAGWKEKLLGVGPDCYGPAVFQRLAAGTDVWKGEHWDGALFTNAHCELLTQLCNVGILGTVCYVWVFLAGIWSFRKEARQAPGWRSVHGEWLGLAALAMYGAHSFVSFQQVLATPYLFLVLGLCENRKRRMRGLLGGQSH